jgi:hypothetical protein
LAADSKRSSMFVGSLVAAIAASVALAFLIVVQVTAPPGPPPGSLQPASGRPPAPPLMNPQNLTSIIVIVAALFAIAWIATIAAAIRDQILRETHRIMSEYGDLRETDGFVAGYHQRGRPEAEVLKLRPVPPID